MHKSSIKIGLLTSSRADYSIYVPLIQAIESEGWCLEIIAFGTHLSEKHGLTYQQIEQDGFKVSHKLPTLVDGDLPVNIASSMGLTLSAFAKFWSQNEYDWVIALGDRYEMFCAVAASVPFNTKIAHIAGGETTLGAIDNAFRHSISHMATLHFVTADAYAKRLSEILGSNKNIYNTGSLSIENFKKLKLLSLSELNERWGVDKDRPFILITLHPETESYENNVRYVSELVKALKCLDDFSLLITMPNSDTMGNFIREKWKIFANEKENVHLVENLGTQGYLSAMQHSFCILGNSSSGFIEAAMFPKWVVNIGRRQAGRILTDNIVQTDFNAEEILSAIHHIRLAGSPHSVNIYGDGRASQIMISAIKDLSSAQE